jgi:MOSC domain-containing protein YiiM
MNLRILSVNIARARAIGTIDGESVISGIDKRGVASDAVQVGFLGIAGDEQADLTVHGGPDKAVYAYPSEHWLWWSGEKHLPRAPCFKLGMHTARADAPALMTVSARCGWYYRVVAEGRAPSRDAVLERVAESGGPTVRAAFRAMFSPHHDRDSLQRIHDAPALAQAWRRSLARKIAQLPERNCES